MPGIYQGGSIYENQLIAKPLLWSGLNELIN